MPLSLSAMHALYNDNTAGDISAGDGRDVIEALYDWIPDWMKYLRGRLPGETPHASDDFFSTFSGYTEVEPLGTAVWTANRFGVSCSFSDQAANDICGAVKALPAGPPLTIETCISNSAHMADNIGWGLVFADGDTTADDVYAIGALHTGAAFQLWRHQGPWGSTTSAGLVASDVFGRGTSPLHFLRLVWKSANTWAFSVSGDGDSWTDFETADQSFTMTPTHMGMFVSSWSVTTDNRANFAYLRVYEADLSV